MWVSRQHTLVEKLGDTDDALRLVIVRDLLSGRAGWFDQHMLRLQPPLGMDLHWSRLIDGGLAAFQWLLRFGLPPDRAEIAMRALWPLMWIVPAAAATISIARQLRGDAAALLCTVMLFMDLLLYPQWRPGRIDHHNIQISLALVVLALTMPGGWRGALLAGLATGLGLAVGLEGLVFFAVIGAAVALRFLIAPSNHARTARAYAGGLLLATLALYLIETPPPHWTLSVCDTIGANLVAAITTASLGLLACTALSDRASMAVRFVSLAVVGAGAGAVYLGLDPTCLRGPLAGADPRIGPIWLSQVKEMQPLAQLMTDPKNAVAWGQAILMGLGLMSWLWLSRQKSARDTAWLIVGAWLAVGVAAGLAAARMAHYPAWIATALMAAAIADLGYGYFRGRLVLMVLVAFFLTPTWPTSIMSMMADRSSAIRARVKLDAKSEDCVTPASFARLAQYPAGLVLGEIDMGPYILATTQHSVLAAPYHRMGWGIVSASQAFGAFPGADEDITRRLHVRYVVSCTGYANSIRHGGLTPQSLQWRLDRGQVPGWLEALSPRDEPVQVYRVNSDPSQP